MFPNENILLIVPLWLQIWLFLSLATHASALIFIRKHQEARWITLGVLISWAWLEWHKQTYGHDRMMGLGHVVSWTPFIIYLIYRLPKIAKGTIFRYWIIWVICLDSAFVVLDTIDVVRYLQGDKYPQVLLDYEAELKAAKIKSTINAAAEQ